MFHGVPSLWLVGRRPLQEASRPVPAEDSKLFVATAQLEFVALGVAENNALHGLNV
ncbi:hypothetical protein BVI2075_180197 [Burkholderia vietnamiensis]|nr:hypothetical protein BVI2075_180197 [Burkholderia vietnamiensis]